MSLRIRSNVLHYVRDSYLGSTTELNPQLPLIDCAIGSSRWGVPTTVMEAHAAFRPVSQTTYPEPFYDSLLKPAILKRFGVGDLSADQLFFGHGSFNLAERLIHKLIEPSKMLGVGPQFNEIPSEFVATGGTYRPVPIRPDTYAFPMAELESELREGNYSVLYLDNPNNPLGRIESLGHLASLAVVAEKHGTIVIIDEAYGDFMEDEESAARLVSTFSNVAVLRSFSKGLGLAAARIGYMFLSNQLAEKYRPLDVPFEPALYSAVMARAALEATDFLPAVRRQATATKTKVVELLGNHGFTVLPTDPRTPILSAYYPGDAVAEFATISVSVEPGSAFQQTNPNWFDAFCRIRLPYEHEVEEFGRRLQHRKKQRR